MVDCDKIANRQIHIQLYYEKHILKLLDKRILCPYYKFSYLLKLAKLVYLGINCGF